MKNSYHFFSSNLATVFIVIVIVCVYAAETALGQTVVLPERDCSTCGSVRTCACGQYLTGLRCYACHDGRSCGGYNSYICKKGSFGRGATGSSGECSIDKYPESEYSFCPLCPLGAWQDQEQSTNCRPCPIGYIGTKRGAVSQADGCSRCESGVSPGGTAGTSCKVCQAGTRIKNAGECEECEKGHYQPLAGQTLCISAQAGYYVPGSGATTQLPCPAGTTSSTTSSECGSCLKGTWSPEGSPKCIDALPGEYVPDDGATSATACGPATYTDAPGSTSCLPCPQGTAHNLNNISNCPSCAAGRYSDVEALRECKKCRPGAAMDPNKTGSTTIVDCKQCAAGTYSENDAATVCESCQKGTASNTRGATSRYYCGKCAKNYYSESPASTECTSCSAGSDSRRIEGADSAALCIPCLSGYWNPSPSGDCRVCEGGTFNTGQGNTAPCQKCDKGQYSPPGSDQCFDCLPGTFCPRDGCNTTCDSCRDVRGYSSAPRSASCQYCLQGYEPNTEATGCQSRTITISSSRSYNGTETQHSISDTVAPTHTFVQTKSNSSSESLSALTKTRFTPSRNFTKTSSKSSSAPQTETKQATPSSSSSKETKSVSQNSPSLSDELSPSKPYVSRTIEDSKSENSSHSLSHSPSIEVSPSKNTHSLSDPTETIQIYPPYKPLGLSAAEQRFQREAIATTAAFVGLASGPTAMAMSRSLGLLQLVGCPKRNPETNNYWSEDRVPFPASLLPGVGFGDKSSKYHRGGVVAFCGVFILAFAFGYMNTEVIGRPMGLSSSKTNDENKEEELMKNKNNDEKKINVKEEPSTGSAASSSARQFPRILYSTIAVVLPVWSPQAGFVFSTFQPDDIVLALLPLVAIFSFVIYMTIKVWKSANDRERGIYFTKSFFMMKSEEGACSSLIISSARAKSMLTSNIGRYWFVGHYFWSRNRGRDNVEAQKLLSALGTQLQRFRGPICRTNFIETADPFIESDDDDEDNEELQAIQRKNNSSDHILNNSSSSCVNNDNNNNNSNNEKDKKKLITNNNNQTRAASKKRNLLKEGNPNVVISSVGCGNKLSKLLSGSSSNENSNNKTSTTSKVLTDWEEKEPPKIQVIEETNTLAARIANNYLLISWFLGSSVLFLQGIALAQPATCTHVAFAILFENIISALIMFWIRPFVVPIRNIAAMLMEASVVISSIIIVAVLLTNEENKFNDKEIAEELKRKSHIAIVVQVMTFVVSIIVTLLTIISATGRQILLTLGNCCAVSHEEMWALRIFNDAEEEELQEQEMNEYRQQSSSNFSDDADNNNNLRTTAVQLPFSPASLSTRAASTRKKKIMEEERQAKKQQKNNNRNIRGVFRRMFSRQEYEDDDDENGGFIPPIISTQQQRSDDELMETLLVPKDKRKRVAPSPSTASSPPATNKKKSKEVEASPKSSSPSTIISARRMRKQHQANEEFLKSFDKKPKIDRKHI